MSPRVTRLPEVVRRRRSDEGPHYVSSRAKPRDRKNMQRRMSLISGEKALYVYIMASKTGVIYIGVTGGLEERVYQHKNKFCGGFTKKYNCTRLIYYEEFGNPDEAIMREKQLKNWNRRKKFELVKELNPKWDDLASDWYG